ncbi:hypothetical protein, partial [Acidiphilium sp.]
MNIEEQLKEKEKSTIDFLKILHDELRHLETIFIRTISFFALILAAINIIIRHFVGYKLALILSTYFSFGLFFISLQFYDRINRAYPVKSDTHYMWGGPMLPNKAG